MKAFARQYGLGEDRVRRELQRGFTGVLLKDKVHGGWIYPEYSALLGQSEASKRQANKGGVIVLPKGKLAICKPNEPGS